MNRQRLLTYIGTKMRMCRKWSILTQPDTELRWPNLPFVVTATKRVRTQWFLEVRIERSCPFQMWGHKLATDRKPFFVSFPSFCIIGKLNFYFIILFVSLFSFSHKLECKYLEIHSLTHAC